MANGNVKITVDAPPEHLDALGGILAGPNTLADLAPGIESRARTAVNAPILPQITTDTPRLQRPMQDVTVTPSGPVMAKSSILGMIPPASADATAPAQKPGIGHRILSVLGKIGEAAGNMLAPEAMAVIPGTSINRGMMEHRREQAELSDSETTQHQAQARQLDAEAGYRKVEGTRPVPVEGGAYNWNNGSGKWEFNAGAGKPGRAPLKNEPLFDKEGNVIGFHSMTGDLLGPNSDKLTQDEKDIMGAAKAKTAPFTDAQFKGDAFKEWQQHNPQGSRIEFEKEWETASSKIPKDNKAVAGTVNGSPDFAIQTDSGWVDVGTKQLKPNFKPTPSFAETGLFEPTEVNVGGVLKPGKFDKRSGRVTLSDVEGGAAIPKSAQSDIDKAMDTARGADTRYRVMLDAEEQALAGNQQAALNILANHMGMTQGLQKGSRITQTIWNEAMQSAPWIDRLLSRFTTVDPDTGDRVITSPMSGVTLTPQQIQQMIDLGKDRRAREWQQVTDTARGHGIDLSGVVPDDVKQSLKGAGDTGRVTVTSDDTPPANLLKEGKITHFGNGQSWTLKDGKQQRVK